MKPSVHPDPAPSAGTGPPAERRRVLLVDDHLIFREALADLINRQADLVVCGQAGDVRETLEAAAATRPELALVDVSLGGRDGIELIKELKQHHPGVLALVLSMHDETVYAERALRAGARGYVMKTQPAERVMAALRRVLAGEVVISDVVAAKVVRGLAGVAAGGSPVDRLSNRELQVFQCIGRGMSVRDIAGQLNLSVKTVESHREHIKQKLNLPTSGDLLRFAIEHARM